MRKPILEVENLEVSIAAAGATLNPVRGVSFTLYEGEIVGVVGESGCGKTVTAMALADLLPSNVTVTSQKHILNGFDLKQLSEKEKDEVFGRNLGVVFQDPLSSLNPALRVEIQLTEGARRHQKLSREEARDMAVEQLKNVRVAAPERRVREYPHQFSGGMRQRAMIAMGLMAQPALLIADEPTTALDVTVQADVVDVLKRINRDSGVAILFVSHNIALLSRFCSRILVMYAGRVVEDLPVEKLRDASHPYTQALMASVPTLDLDMQRDLPTIGGMPPDPRFEIAGCAFRPRCSEAIEVCGTDVSLLRIGNSHEVACHLRKSVKPDA